MLAIFQVTRFERLKSDMNTLLALCEKTDNDIRSCLNTLQVRLNSTSLYVLSCQEITEGYSRVGNISFSQFLSSET